MDWGLESLKYYIEHVILLYHGSCARIGIIDLERYYNAIAVFEVYSSNRTKFELIFIPLEKFELSRRSTAGIGNLFGVKWQKIKNFKGHTPYFISILQFKF